MTTKINSFPVDSGDPVVVTSGSGAANFSVGAGFINQPTDSPIATIDQTLSTFSQEIDVTESMIATIAQVLPGFTQDFEALMVSGSIITQTLQGIVQDFEASALKIDIAQTLPGFSMKNINRSSITLRARHPIPMSWY